jgi:hypothetical protein
MPWIKGRQNVNEREDTSDVILTEGGEQKSEISLTFLNFKCVPLYARKKGLRPLKKISSGNLCPF